MPLPTSGPASRAAVKAALGVDPADTSEDAAIDVYVAAANALVRALPVVEVANVDPAPADWSDPAYAAILLGANTLGARLYRRKHSPDGTSEFASEGPVYVQRNDPDLAQLLQLGDYAKPAVG